MRKLLVSNLLLIMFLVGAASGFLVANIGWWGMVRGAQDLERLHDAGAGTPAQVARIEALALNRESLLVDALRRPPLTEAGKASLERIDADLDHEFASLPADPAGVAKWQPLVDLHAGAATGRFDVGAALSQNNALLAALHGLAAQSAEAADQTYLESVAFNRDMRRLLVAMTLLASIFFCVTAGLTYRESRERRRKSAQLVQEHTLFRTLFDASNDGVILMEQGRITGLNLAALQLFSLPSPQALDEHGIAALLPETQPDGTPSTDALQGHIGDAAQVGSRRCEWHFRALDGREFPAELAIDAARLPGKDVIQLTIRDISRRKQAELSMRLANHSFENSLEGIAITDRSGNIIAVNSAFTTITGYEMAEVIGRNPRLLSSGRQPSSFYETMWQSIAAHGKWQGEIWNVRKNGDIYPQWLNISKVTDETGEVTNYVGVFSDISERKSAEERILHQVYYDQLTGMPNRRLFNDCLHRAAAMRHGKDHGFGLMLLDLDRFKTVNDTLGHALGDVLLKAAAMRLQGCVRGGDTLARMGGDEFAILVQEVAHPEDAARLAEKLLAALKEPFVLDGHELYVTTSIGITLFPDDGGDAEALIRNADIALYRAKDLGGNNFRFFTGDMTASMMQRLRLESSMRWAIERGEFMLHYQPQADVVTGRIRGTEALIRWRHPELGMVSPGQFIPIAEESGMIVQIGEWILRTACAQAKEWERAGMPMRVAVNLSARQFHRGGLAETVTAILQEYDLAPELLELELTEGILMEDTTQTAATLGRLHAMGVQISIDDFGTGYSSLAYLKRLPIQVLKIDQSFVRDIDTDPDDRAIVTAVIALAHSMRLKVVAEGVETDEQLSFLRAHRCDIMQGYLFSRPVPGDELLALLRAEQARRLDSDAHVEVCTVESA